MAKILILEDDPNRMEVFRVAFKDRHEISAADNAADFITLLNTQAAEVIFLDHDLGGLQFVDTADKNTGSEVVRHLVANFGGSHSVPIIIHSHNTPAAARMQDTLRAGGFRKVYMIPFAKLANDYLHDPGFIT